MRGDTYPAEVAVDSVLARLRSVSGYVRIFAEVFGPESTIDADEVARAIAAFERTLIAIDSPFDRYQAGDVTAMTAQQIRGMREFDDARCTECHDGPMFSDFDLHAEGVAENALLASPDVGDGRFRFRTPSLRNVALTAPYMHNGVLATLQDVLDFYDEGESENPNVTENRRRGRRGNGDGTPSGVLDNDFQRVRNMGDDEMADIIAFLEALTDPAFDRTIPESVPSGLTPGGATVLVPADDAAP
jgi:cytochrome c peroxidase